VKQLGFVCFQVVQKPFALSFHVPALALPDDPSSGSRVIIPSGVNVILNFVPESDTAVNGCPVKKVAFMSFGGIGSAAKPALVPKSINVRARIPRSTQRSPSESAVSIADVSRDAKRIERNIGCDISSSASASRSSAVNQSRLGFTFSINFVQRVARTKKKKTPPELR
jgi:hypothetical protein